MALSKCCWHVLTDLILISSSMFHAVDKETIPFYSYTCNINLKCSYCKFPLLMCPKISMASLFEILDFREKKSKQFLFIAVLYA